jgi:hypothetical protein
MMATAKQLRSRRYQRTCREKLVYRTLAEAERAAREVNGRIVLKFPDGEIEAYRCDFTRHWHLGHNKTTWG